VCNPLAVVLQTQEMRSEEKGLFVGSCWPSARPPGRPASGARQKATTAAQSQVKPLSVIPTRGAAYLDANIITRHAHSQWGRNKLRKDDPLFCFFLSFFYFSFGFRLALFACLWRNSYTFLFSFQFQLNFLLELCQTRSSLSHSHRPLLPLSLLSTGFLLADVFLQVASLLLNVWPCSFKSLDACVVLARPLSVAYRMLPLSLAHHYNTTRTSDDDNNCRTEYKRGKRKTKRERQVKSPAIPCTDIRCALSVSCNSFDLQQQQQQQSSSFSTSSSSCPSTRYAATHPQMLINNRHEKEAQVAQ